MSAAAPTIVPGNILFGRPLFCNRRRSHDRLDAHEHPMIVLKVVQEGDVPHSLVALAIPLSTSPVCAQNPNAERARPGLIKGLVAKDDRDTWFCADSPNMVRLHGVENGLRINTRRHDHDAHHFCHGHMNDPKTLARLLEKTQGYILHNGYRPPIQGEKAPVRRTATLDKAADRRIAMIQAAARLESAQHGAGIPSLQDGLQALGQKRPTLGLKNAALR